MKLDPQAEKYIHAMSQSGVVPYHLLTPVEARASYETRRAAVEPAPQPVASIQELSALGSPHGLVPLRYYRPRGSEERDVLPVLIYIHGGGWTIGNLETHDTLCRQLANQIPCAVIAVDYRLAPEHRFPAAVDDCWAALIWISQNAAKLRIDPRNISVGGDSAGGTLTAVLTIRARDEGAPKIAAQVLIYPSTDMDMETPSHETRGQGYLLTRDTLLYFRKNYLDAKDFSNWWAAPRRHIDPSGLPPALICTAGFDPLLDEGRLYAEHLERVGNAVEYRCYEGMIHGFIRMGRVFDQAEVAINDICHFLVRKRN